MIHLKHLFPLILPCMLAQPMVSMAQPQAMVGDTIAVQYVSLPISKYGCTYQGVYSNTLRNNVVFWSIGPNNTFVLFSPIKKGFVSDVVDYNIGLPTEAFCKPRTSQETANVSAIGIDSVTTIAVKYPTIVFQLDTVKGYRSPSVAQSLFNNVSDTTYCTSWELVVSNDAKLSFQADTSGVKLTSYTILPFTKRKDIVFTFTTTLAPTDTVRTFPAKLLTYVHKAGKDTVYENDLTFIMPALPQNGVRQEQENVTTFSIYPNPSAGEATIFVSLNKSEQVKIEVYDLLGNKKIVLGGGNYLAGNYQFRLNKGKLSQGEYFVRLQTGKTALTKKFIVQ